MREIKFRAWDGEKMTYFHPLAHTESYNQLACQPISSNKEEWIDTWTTDKCDGLMQFTGLTDTNGKEIYEGDIV